MNYFENDIEARKLLETFPENTRKGITEYVTNRKPLGGFLTSLFANDLFATYGRADALNKPLIPAYVNFIYWHCPYTCHGSYERVKHWIEEGQNREEL